LVRIITDSAADFEPIELERLNVECVPLSVIFGNKEYKENINITKDQFYTMLKQNGAMPRTAQPAPQEFADHILAAKAAEDDAVIITISSGLSGTYQGAVLAQSIANYDRCYVIDSLNGTGGERVLVEYAVRLRDMGKSGKEIAEAITEARSRVVLYTCMDTLEFLHRGGRISHTAYTIGSIAHIKPIMHVDKSGRPEIPAKVLGIRKGIEYLCKKVSDIPPDPEFDIYVMYTADRSNGEKLAQRLGEMGYVIPSQRIVPVGAVVGAHIGPGACAVVYIAKKQQA